MRDVKAQIEKISVVFLLFRRRLRFRYCIVMISARSLALIDPPRKSRVINYPAEWKSKARSTQCYCHALFGTTVIWPSTSRTAKRTSSKLVLSRSRIACRTSSCVKPERLRCSSWMMPSFTSRMGPPHSRLRKRCERRETKAIPRFEMKSIATLRSPASRCVFPATIAV